MLLNIPTRINKELYRETYLEISKIKEVVIKSGYNDYELISVMADGKPLIDVINIVLKRGIAE